MKQNLSIGEMIHEEVLKQQIDITKFADMCHCSRNNVYNIFSRNSIDILQLGMISEVLNRNFIKEIADNPEILNLHSPESQAVIEEKRAVSQFIDIMPKVLQKLGRITIISFGGQLDYAESLALPEFALPDYAITFSIGKYLREKSELGNLPALLFKHVKNKQGLEFELVYNKLSGKNVGINILINYKTEDEWTALMKWIFMLMFPDNFHGERVDMMNDPDYDPLKYINL